MARLPLIAREQGELSARLPQLLVDLAWDTGQIPVADKEVICVTGGQGAADGAAQPLLIVGVVDDNNIWPLKVARLKLLTTMAHHQNNPLSKGQGIFETCIKHCPLAIR